MEASAVLPRTEVRTIDQPPARVAPLDSTRLLVALESFRGTRAPMRFRSPRDVSRALERTGVGIPAWDAVDVALREGVPEVWLTRILGPAAASASVALAGGTGTSLTVAALEPGEWGNGAAGGLSAEVVNGPAGGSERVVIVRRGGVEVARSGPATTRALLAAAIARIASPALTVTLGTDVGLPTVAASANFTGGTADSAAITATHVRAALDRVPEDLGPMTVATPWRNTDATNTELLSYCQATGRTALLEQADLLSVGTVKASAATLRALGSGAEGRARLGGMWPLYATGAGVLTGTTRAVPWTVIVAGLIARLERTEQHPNVAPIGDYGVPLWATGLTREFTEAEAADLFAAGVNVAHIHSVLGVRNRTFRTLELEGTSEWIDLAHTRLERAIRAEAMDVGRAMGGSPITREVIADFGARLRSRLERKFWRTGALFGDTPDEAFRVDVDTVNDATSIAAHEVNASVGLRMSEHAEFVNVELAKVPIGQEV